MSRTVRLAVAVCAIAVASPIVDSAAAQDGSPHVLVATTGNQSELRETVRITKKRGPGKLVMSLGPEELPSLSNGDRLLATAELEVTTDCAVESVGCVGTPYKYNPSLTTSLILGDDASATGGEGAVEIDSQRTKCNQRDSAHHCLIVFTGSSLDIAGQAPCAPSSCHLNLVVESHKARAKKGNRLLMGENEPDGSVGQDKGRLNVTRFSPGSQPAISPLTTTTPLVTSIPVRKGEDIVVYSQELSGLEKDDQLAASASMTVDVSHLSYGPLIRSRLILALDPTSTAPGHDVKQLTDPKGEISEANGYNCTQRKPSCVTRKVGVISMRKDAEDASGDPIPLYANLVVDTAKPGGTAAAGDTVQIDPTGGALNVTRYPASLKG